MTYAEAIISLSLKFTSGNDIDVEQATITRDELTAIIKEANDLRKTILNNGGVIV